MRPSGCIDDKDRPNWPRRCLSRLPRASHPDGGRHCGVPAKCRPLTLQWRAEKLPPEPFESRPSFQSPAGCPQTAMHLRTVLRAPVFANRRWYRPRVEVTSIGSLQRCDEYQRGAFRRLSNIRHITKRRQRICLEIDACHARSDRI